MLAIFFIFIKKERTMLNMYDVMKYKDRIIGVLKFNITALKMFNFNIYFIQFYNVKTKSDLRFVQK